VLAGCNLVHYKSPLPSKFRYFSSSTAGGHTQIADFCPRAYEYPNGDCTDTNNNGWMDHATGAVVGSDSRCFYSSLLSRRHIPDGLSVEAQCLRRTCTANRLEIHVNDKTVYCPVSNLASTMTVDGYNGYILCPPYSGLGDIRCTPTCSAEDLECLGIKGSAADLRGSHVMPEEGGTVVVHGRHLRH